MAVPNTGRLLSICGFFVCFVCLFLSWPHLDVQSVQLKNKKEKLSVFLLE